MAAVIINEKNFKKEVERCKKPVLLGFGAESEKSFSALLLKQTADAVSDETGGEIKVGVVELNPNNAALIKIAKKFNIHFLPTTILIINNIVADRIIGNMAKEDFIRILESS
ncbi:MAG: hypothetical protein FWG70_08540 [Oscillospiraceae bacterium]|nr:hypothetical protein [Oscillospiraceae bacterium]